MTLLDWARNGWLVEHRPTRRQISDLLAVAERDLSDCRAEGLSADWRLNIAYNAALQLATAALVAAGYRAAREGHHYRVIQSLAYTVGVDRALIVEFDALRKKRNIAGYERVGAISDKEAEAMLKLANRLRRDVTDWLKTRPRLPQ